MAATRLALTKFLSITSKHSFAVTYRDGELQEIKRNCENCKIRSVRESSEPKQPLDFAEARKIVIETVRALPHAYGKESTGLEEAHGRVLAENVAADRDYPSLRRSLRDGFAVRIGDLPASCGFEAKYGPEKNRKSHYRLAKRWKL